MRDDSQGTGGDGTHFTWRDPRVPPGKIAQFIAIPRTYPGAEMIVNAFAAGVVGREQSGETGPPEPAGAEA